MPNDALVAHSQETIAKMEADEEFADEMRFVSSALRQAVHGLQTGKYATFEDAMEAICGFRPLLVQSDDGLDLIDWNSVSIRHGTRPLSEDKDDI